MTQRRLVGTRPGSSEFFLNDCSTVGFCFLYQCLQALILVSSARVTNVLPPRCLPQKVSTKDFVRGCGDDSLACSMECFQ